MGSKVSLGNGGVRLWVREGFQRYLWARDFFGQDIFGSERSPTISFSLSETHPTVFPYGCTLTPNVERLLLFAPSSFPAYPTLIRTESQASSNSLFNMLALLMLASLIKTHSFLKCTRSLLRL